MMKNDLSPEAACTAETPLELPLEVRVHGRGGQGGVTCAKLIATLYTTTARAATPDSRNKVAVPHVAQMP